eukprot:TRINITY_DN2594_c0_g1_i1.p1 TRINITY_DN2594_c0_g1~~TRINITY_DN2594_c0_g1_i1.p1  ORF type:complete len:320 (-),score=68.42 TRINITY_DN2594_c0_g1_i1:84-1019(-)
MWLKIISGSSNKQLAEMIAHMLGGELVNCVIDRLHDGECRVEIKDNLRGCDVYVIQSTCPPVNETLMEMLIIIDALRRSSVRRITAVIPYYGYGRQDHKSNNNNSHIPITAKLVADMIATAGTDRVLTMDLHNSEIQGFFNIPVDNLQSDYVLLNHMGDFNSKCCIVAPNYMVARRAQNLAEKVNVSLCILDRRSEDDEESDIVHIVGEVKPTAFIFAGTIGSAKTLITAAHALRDAGCQKIFAFASHGIFSGDAIELLEESPILKVLVTDSIPQEENIRKSNKIQMATLVGLLSEAIRRLYNNESLEEFF